MHTDRTDTIDPGSAAAELRTREVGWDGAVAPLAEPDYWLSLAADLRAVADLVGSLAGTPAHVSFVTVGICAGLVPSEAPDGIATVDAIAAAFGGSASTGHHNGSALWEHRVDPRVGEVVLSAFAIVPKPASVEDELRAEVEALRAQLAKGGAR
ncbi:hypothetical protein [Salinispora arenicola]|uniref:hypothetical protein n=1 Tax=Salinispora arenicola TaxID=168697 RepID=UPI0003A996CA|nr:hypothetical protein [Salinispora arenicola]